VSDDERRTVLLQQYAALAVIASSSSSVEYHSMLGHERVDKINAAIKEEMRALADRLWPSVATDRKKTCAEYRRPPTIMGGPCLSCGYSQSEHEWESHRV